MKSKIILILFIVLLFFTVGCGTQEQTIKIGYIGPLTGDAASIGAPGVAAAELAIQEINDEGGVLGKQLTLIVEDDKCSKASVEAIRKLIDVDKVTAISGPDCGSAAGPALPIAQQANMPVVIRWASVPSLPSIGDYIFRIYPSDAFQGTYAADYIFNTLGKEKVAVLYVKNDYGQGLHDVFVEAFTKLGGEIVYDDFHNQEDTDAKTSLLKAQQANPELVYLPSYRAIGRIILKQMKEIGLDVPVVAGDAFDTDEIIEAEEAEGVLYSLAVTNNPEAFKEKVLALTGVEADKITAPLAYDSVKIIAEAIERAGSLDKDKIRDELAKTNYQGVTHDLITFDETGDIIGAAYEMKIVKNKQSVKYEHK